MDVSARLLRFAVLCALTTVGLGCSSGVSHAGVSAVDYDGLADQVVGNSAAVREGDLVQVLGTVEDSALMEALAVAIRRRGAFPLLTLTSERLERRMYEKVPEKYDASHRSSS